MLGDYLYPSFETVTTANHSGIEKTRVRHCIGPLLCRAQVLVARVWARIGRQVHTGVIIPAMARYWQPIFGNSFADSGPVLVGIQLCYWVFKRGNKTKNTCFLIDVK